MKKLVYKFESKNHAGYSVTDMVSKRRKTAQKTALNALTIKYKLSILVPKRIMDARISAYKGYINYCRLCDKIRRDNLNKVR